MVVELIKRSHYDDDGYAKTRVMPIVGILYDRVQADGREEAVPVSSSEIRSKALKGASVVDDSAHPVIRDGDAVLMEPVGILSAENIAPLEGRIVAVTGKSGAESFGYLKRMGDEIAPGIRIFESVGFGGSSVRLALTSEAVNSNATLLKLDRLWRVHGVVRLRPEAAREKVPSISDLNLGKPGSDRGSGLFGDFKLNRPARLFLNDVGAVSDPIAGADIVDL